VHCSSAHIRQVGADAALEGVQPLVRSRYTFPSRLPSPSRLAVPARPVVVGAAPTHTLRFQGRTAPSFNDPLRRAAVGSLTPLGQSTPRGALRARGTIQASRRGGRTKRSGSKPIAQTGLPACVLPTKPLSRIARPYGRHQTEPSQSSFMPRSERWSGSHGGAFPGPRAGVIVSGRVANAVRHDAGACHGDGRRPGRPG
jgi:hypothetical protein